MVITVIPLELGIDTYVLELRQLKFDLGGRKNS